MLSDSTINRKAALSASSHCLLKFEQAYTISMVISHCIGLNINNYNNLLLVGKRLFELGETFFYSNRSEPYTVLT